MGVTIVHSISSAPGWSPILRMVGLLGDIAGTPPIFIPHRGAGRLSRILNRRPPPTGRPDDVLIAVLTSGTDLIDLRMSPVFRQGYGRVAVWIVDSFRTDHIGRWDSFAGIDLLAISQGYDLEFYRARHRGELVVLPYGANALAQPDPPDHRPHDLVRIGRQPEAWADDDATATHCAGAGLTFHGRPPFSDSPDQNHDNVQELLRNAKCALAFSNLVSQESYTHLTKPYFSARWADALACGAAVAGIPPWGDAAFADLLWEGALVELGSLDRAEGLEAIAEYCAQWTPATARINQARAMLRLDWRWRFHTLFDRLGIASPRLDAELAVLEHRAAKLLDPPGRLARTEPDHRPQPVQFS